MKVIRIKGLKKKRPLRWLVTIPENPMLTKAIQATQRTAYRRGYSRKQSTQFALNLFSSEVRRALGALEPATS